MAKILIHIEKIDEPDKGFVGCESTNIYKTSIELPQGVTMFGIMCVCAKALMDKYGIIINR